MEILNKQEAKEIVENQIDRIEVKISKVDWTFNGSRIELWSLVWLDEDCDEHTREFYVKEA